MILSGVCIFLGAVIPSLRGVFGILVIIFFVIAYINSRSYDRSWAFCSQSQKESMIDDAIITWKSEGIEIKRPFLDAVGIDAFQTARNNGFKIDVLYAPDIKPNYISFVLIE